MNKKNQMQRLHEKLAALNPCQLEIIDESDKHQGHGGHKDGFLTHVHIIIGLQGVDNRTRVERHKIVLDALSLEFKDFLHAAQITIVGCHHA